MTFDITPPKQGLYDPKFEHDNCGIGFIVNKKGNKSHKILTQSLSILNNLTHRGGFGSEIGTGDGAGIIIQLPHSMFVKVCKENNIDLPEVGNYGVGMMFFSNDIDDTDKREAIKKQFEIIVQEEGQHFLGWRLVPVDPSSLGSTARRSMPLIEQAFIGKSRNIKEEIEFERKLYIIRRRAEKYASNNKIRFYVASLSCRTIVYKGMLTPKQVDSFYKDLRDPSAETALALVHSRYSTNTFPSWERAHPNRYIIHNGEINTLRGNVNWMTAREGILKSDLLGDISKVLPVISAEGSDSAMFDNCLEFLTLTGRSLPHSVMMMIPEPWSKHKEMDRERKAFYEYHSCLMEPWDGPAAMAFTDGIVVGAVLDRNGLRPARYYVTDDDLVIMASEVGVLDIPPDKIICKERLHPGKILLIDTKIGELVTDDECKRTIVNQYPYQKWIDENLVNLSDIPERPEVNQENWDEEKILKYQKVFGYTYEDLRFMLAPLAQNGIDPIGAMGFDSPLAVLSEKSQLLFSYFKQLFAQVTNPPIDALREELVTASDTFVGTERNLLDPTSESCKTIRVEYPVISNRELAKIDELNLDGFRSVVLPISFNPVQGGCGLESALNELFMKADLAIKNSVNILILSDKNIDEEKAPIPSLLAVSGLHNYLIKSGTRTKVGIVIESGEAREVHHFCLLIGYGASAVNPYLALETLKNMCSDGLMGDTSYEKAEMTYLKAAAKGVIKVLSKMGISTVQSYQGAQVFEAIGLSNDVINNYFCNTPSRVGGIGMDVIAEEVNIRHIKAFGEASTNKHEDKELDSGGYIQWRKNGEYHLLNPESIHKLQYACRNNDYNVFKEYSTLIKSESQPLCTLRDLMGLKTLEVPIPIDEVESVDSICKRFRTGAMSYGSLSKEAHESIAIAMNRIGGKSNSGEGGEDPERFTLLPNGDSKCSAVKQVASGRFGVNSNYLTNAKEIQIKMAQGAKPGEGGQLPGKKVYPWVAKARNSTPGVGLISPPPHHDIYSIEDLSQLIYDLKNANRSAKINVKLVSEVGVGTIAAGVAKGKADTILISGFDGGTGASPRTSIRHAGLPWELGLSEAHQTLVLNNLRSRVKLEADGKFLTGKDIVIAALLGAEEFGFATAPLIALGCVMMRICNLDTCPVGIATQNPELRKKFSGNPQYIVNFMRFIAQETREIMANLGFRTIDEMIGRTDKIKVDNSNVHWKAKNIDLSEILHALQISESVGQYFQVEQEHNLEDTIDVSRLLEICEPALSMQQKVRATLPIRNINRSVGTILGNEITKRYGLKGLPSETIHLCFKGSAGQSFGAFVPTGVMLELEGDSNDYIGKGLCGASIVVYPPEGSKFIPEENVIIGNVAFYGATAGEAYIKGLAGERFCVRNSGVSAVVEGVGDHGCEYMTGGRVVILGCVGRNFAAGMSGGIAYVLDTNNQLEQKCNFEMIEIEILSNLDEIMQVKNMIEKHVKYTKSILGDKILRDWDQNLQNFRKIIPKDYKRMLDIMESIKRKGVTEDEILMAAFEENNKDITRVTGA